MKDIPGYEGIYAATEDGKIWSYPKRMHRGKWLTPTLNTADGYLRITLTDKFNKRDMFVVHRLVAMTFLSKPELQVNHRNGIKADNRIKNLEWVTPSENSYHAHQVLNIGKAKGEGKRNAKLTEEKVNELRKLAKTKVYTYKQLGNMFGVNDAVISRVINRQAWTHI